jgi:hypothetical protein
LRSSKTADPKPGYMMWLEWRDGRISFIRDYRYARYFVADAELAPDAKPAATAPRPDSARLKSRR